MSTATASYNQTKNSPNTTEKRKFCIHRSVLLLLTITTLAICLLFIYRYPIYPYTLYDIWNFPLFSVVMNSTMSAATARMPLHH